MTSYNRNVFLSSLVMNPPYKIDNFTTSPKISKLLTFPFGIKIDSYYLLQLCIQSFTSASLFMLLASVLLFTIYLPIQNQNNILLTNLKTLSNKKLVLLGNIQEASNYNKLFSYAERLDLKDAKGIITVKTSTYQGQGQGQGQGQNKNQTLAFNKYPTIQFAGF